MSTCVSRNNPRPCRGTHAPIEARTIDKENWQYNMRRVMQEVCKDVFLGPYSVATTARLDYLTDNGITHIICVRQELEKRFVKANFQHLNKFQYLILTVADCVTENIIQHFRTVKAFIDKAHAAKGRVLIHGNAGISRSAALVIAYIMETYERSFEDSIREVQGKRYCINPNEGFIQQLKEYELIYKAKNMYSTGQPRSNQINKRSISMVEPSDPSEEPMEFA